MNPTDATGSSMIDWRTDRVRAARGLADTDLVATAAEIALLRGEGAA